MCLRVVAIDVREGGQSVAAGPTGHGVGSLVGHLLQSEQRDSGFEVVRTLHVGVQACDFDVELPGDCRYGHVLEADLVGQFRARHREAVGCESCARHVNRSCSLGG
ncbi:Uncharacterised protein [Mycobacteroides abscessus subsp. abscessus]|nr:Uncharacterised protein [Mycobacteroides abscessus subsp. abscessus]